MHNVDANMSAPERTVRRYLECVNAADAAGVASLFAADGWLRPPMGGALQGPDAIQRLYARTFSTRKVRAVPTAFVTEGRRCVVTLSTSVDGVTHEFIDLFVIRDDGLIDEMVAYHRGAPTG